MDTAERSWFPRRMRTAEGWLALAFALTLAVPAARDAVVLVPVLVVLLWFTGLGILWVLARLWEDHFWPATPAFARPRPVSARGLRDDPNAGFFVTRGGFLFRKRWFFAATGQPPLAYPAAGFAEDRERQRTSPVRVTANTHRSYWWFEDRFYWTVEDFEPRDVVALVRDRQRRADRKLQRAHTMLAVDADPTTRREPIPRDIRRAVYERDSGRCVECSATFDLQYDHVLPVALGGATTVQNLQLLCSDCNREKADNL